MSQYSLQDRVPSCEVTKEFLITLENYLLNELSSRFKGSEKHRSYSISITDDLGTEEFATIQDFTPKLLPDATKSVGIKWNNGIHTEPAIMVRISFNPSTYFVLSFHADVNGRNAREIALGIRDRFNALIQPYRTLNWIFNPAPFFADFIGFLLWIAVIPVGIWALSMNKHTLVLLVLVTMTLFWYSISGTTFRRYITFDTKLQARKSAAWKWISLGFLTFLLFGTVLLYARRQIFGF